jgi:hypothetical protein
MVAEQPLHLLRALEAPVGEALAPEAQFVDRAFLADRGDHVLQHALVGTMVEDVPGGEAAHAEPPRHRVQRVEPRRVARAAAQGVDEGSAVAPNVGGVGQRGGRGRIRRIRDERRHQPLAPGGDILPVEEALPLLALAAVDPPLADGQQPRQPRPGGAVLRPHQQRIAVHQVQPAARDQPHMGRLARQQRPHHAGNAVAVGDPQRIIAQVRRRREQLLTGRGAAQEGEVAGRLQLDVGHCGGRRT